MIVLVEYRCPECEKRFNCPANLASHRRWHKPRSETTNNTKDIGSNKDSNSNKHSCIICHKVFRKPQSLSKHMARLHNNNNNNHAPSSNVGSETDKGKTFKVESDELVCQVCSQVFQTLDELANHRSENHSDTFPCKSCQEIFYSLAGLTRHNNRFHLD
jgi:uncharacterized C2H2 Zn-finger protein